MTGVVHGSFGRQVPRRDLSSLIADHTLRVYRAFVGLRLVTLSTSVGMFTFTREEWDRAKPAVRFGSPLHTDQV